MTVTRIEEWGELVERAVADRLGLEQVDDDVAEWFDLTTDVDVHVLDEPGTVGVVQEGDAVEVKSAARYTESSEQRGRWHLARDNHERLVLEGGIYVLVVYDHDKASEDLDVDDVRDVIDHLVVLPAETVDHHVQSWRPNGRGREYTQVSWSTLVDPSAGEPRDGRERDVEQRVRADGGVRNSTRINCDGCGLTFTSWKEFEDHECRRHPLDVSIDEDSSDDDPDAGAAPLVADGGIQKSTSLEDMGRAQLRREIRREVAFEPTDGRLRVEELRRLIRFVRTLKSPDDDRQDSTAATRFESNTGERPNQANGRRTPARSKPASAMRTETPQSDKRSVEEETDGQLHHPPEHLQAEWTTLRDLFEGDGR